MESHYTRRKYKDQNKYLQKILNKKEMYRLSCEFIASDSEMLVRKLYYRDVLRTDFHNLAFHRPKKINATFVLV